MYSLSTYHLVNNLNLTFFSSFHPLNLNLTFSIDRAKTQSGGHSWQLPMHALLWDEGERGFLGWAMGAPHGTAKPQPADLSLPPAQLICSSPVD